MIPQITRKFCHMQILVVKADMYNGSPQVLEMTGIKWAKFRSKTMGKKQKVLLRNVETNSCEVTGKQIGNIPHLAQNKLDEKIKRQNGSSLWLLHNTDYDVDAQRVPSCGWEDLTHKSASELQNLFWSNRIGYCSVNFYFHCILMWQCHAWYKHSFRAFIYTK